MRSTLVVSFVFLACCFFLSNYAPPSTVSAQADDAALDRMIKRLTDRSTDGLIPVQRPDGTIQIDVEGRFQNAVLARIDEGGDPLVACVTGPGEAYEFFGRDLETGDAVSSDRYRKHKVSDAARHGMSQQEFAFYKKLIEEAAEAPGSASFGIINGDSAGEGFNDPTAATPEGGNSGTTRGEQRLNLFNFAGTIWGAFLDSTVTTVTNARFDPMPCGILGSAGNMSIYANFPNAPLQQTLYHGALANKLAGSDLGGITGGAEIAITFNSSMDGGCGGTRYYYGFDNATPAGRINLLIVTLHEMGHGLGFTSFANGSTGAFLAGLPDIYSRNMFDRTTGKYWHEMTNVERVASAVNAGNVLWDGANVRAASGYLTSGREASTGRVQLYTPGVLQGGSSFIHWDTTVNPPPLMAPFIASSMGLSLDLTRQQMRDIGWYRDANGDNLPDTITNVQPSGGIVGIDTTVNITWTNSSGFNRNVTIELSRDGGNTWPVTIASDIANTGSFPWTVPNLITSQARVRVREHNFVSPSGASAANFGIFWLDYSPRPHFDYDGDGRTDVSTFRPSNGVWYLNRSASAGVIGMAWGSATDRIAPADYDGDYKTDIAVFRPAEGRWYIFNSATSTFTSVVWGVATDIPAPGYFDSDERSDVAIFRPSDGNWWLNRSTGGTIAMQFGQLGDHPVVGDYDGDRISDIGIFRPSNGVWFIRRSTAGVIGYQFGVGTDKVTPADYDGDGKTDIAVYRPSEGRWYIVNSGSLTYPVHIFGAATDIPAPGDYDGDGRADIAIFRPSDGNWWINRTAAGLIVQQFGQNGDKPTPNAFGN